MLALAIATMSSFSSSGDSVAIFFFFGLLKTERIRVDQSRIDAIGHDLIESLG